MKCDLQLWSRKAPVSELLQSQRLSEAWWWWCFRPISDPSDSKHADETQTSEESTHALYSETFLLWLDHKLLNFRICK